MDEMIYPCPNLNYTMLAEETPDGHIDDGQRLIEVWKSIYALESRAMICLNNDLSTICHQAIIRTRDDDTQKLT